MVDYLIVGAGLYGATCARLINEAGKSCLIIDKRPHIGGNVYTAKQSDGVDVHMYGAHIFHTNNEKVWNFVNTFDEMLQYNHTVIANYKDKLYHLPFNLTTMYELFGTYDVDKIKTLIQDEITKYVEETHADNKLWGVDGNPITLESQAISLVGTTIYKTLIQGYTEKQWGKQCNELSSDIIKRLPIRYRFDNSYFNDKHQGLPKHGYTYLVEQIIGSVPVLLNTDYLKDIDFWNSQAKNVIYCGAPDELLGYKFGELEWRSLRFDTVQKPCEIFQGIPVVNYTGKDNLFTRVIEHKMFMSPDSIEKTFYSTVTYEYPTKWERRLERYYSVNNERTAELYVKYVEAITRIYPNLYLGGRLGLYKYLDMDDTISEAMKFCDKILDKEWEEL